MATVATLAVPLVVVAVVVALGMSAWSRGDLNRFICDGDCGPSNVIAPAELATASSPSVPAPAEPTGGAIDPAKLSAAVSPELDADVLGSRVGFAAVSPDGTELMASGSGAYTPASTTKILTGFAALATMDPATRFSTRVVRAPDGGIVLVGGGDPYLTDRRPGRAADRVYQADLATLARRTATVLEQAGTTTVTLGYDSSLFMGPEASPTWEPTYVTQDIVTPVTALWIDRGVTDDGRSRDPDAAARAFSAQLERRGITVQGDPASAAARPGAEEVAQVRSATLAQIVETLVRVSDNEAAEVVLRQVAVAAGRDADFDGGVAEVRAALEGAGVDVAGLELHDGSGLSRANRIAPATLVGALRAATASPRTSGLLADLPVSGFTGTLVSRFAELAEARGEVRAKTGTLTGIHSLAGYAVDADGRPVLFAVMADRTDRDMPFGAQAALDRVAAAIADCSCG